MIAVFCFALVIAGVIFTSYVQAESTIPAEGEKLITIHDRGHDRGILTSASTLRAAFEEVGIEIDPNDTVEPGLDDALTAKNYEVNIYRARPVTIIDGTVREKVMSPYRTAKQIAEQANITLQDEDKAEIVATTDMVTQGVGLQISIERATPFTLVLYGKRTTAYTQEKTVADMLKSKNITLGSSDSLSVPLDTPMQADMTVELWRNGVQTVTEERDIEFKIEKIQDTEKEVGFREIKTPGEKGKRAVTYEIDMRNGVEVARKEIQSVVLHEPKKQVEVIGTKMKNTFSGSFAEALARLRACESGGNYANTRNPKYRGAYQYDYSTWANYGGFYDPADAPPAVQDQKAWETYQRRGWQPWPSCSVKQGLQDIYR